MGKVVLLVAAFLVAGCGSAAAVATGVPAPSPVAAAPAAEITPSPSPAPGVSQPAPAAPVAIPVTFSHISPGTYGVHLHSRCIGSQGYHLAYLPNLRVGPALQGSILVPSSDFGRGWCVIVYADARLSVVLTTRRI